MPRGKLTNIILLEDITLPSKFASLCPQINVAFKELQRKLFVYYGMGNEKIIMTDQKAENKLLLSAEPLTRHLYHIFL